MTEQQQQRQQLVQGFQLYQTRNHAQNLSSRMSEGPSYQQRSQAHSRFGGGLRRTQGEIVEVQGGHIVRSTGRKDRHSKVCTSKGPRDRRVRLSAHTAIQFYDVQDRLGYDRPSKAVDWLMKNAKAAIDELAELPPWHPTANLSASQEPDDKDTHRFGGDIGDRDAHQFGGGTGERSSSALQPSLDSGSLTETFKSFFPGANSSSYVPSTSLPTGFQSYPSGLPSHADSQNQDLRLSLQSFQDPVFVQPNAAHHFDANAMAQWNVAESSSGGGGNVYGVPIFGQSQFLTPRESLQSSNPTFVRAWIDPMTSDHLMHSVIHPSVRSIGFASGSGSSRFRIPARIQGEQEREGVSDKPSSGSRH